MTKGTIPDTMKLAAVAMAVLAVAGAILFLGSRPSPALPTSAPPAPAPTDAITANLSDYIWPTDAGNTVTSTFGEFRSSHFHGGVDVSTNNAKGFHVYAMRDGYVSRIQISPNGYGKMLFVRHPDGYTTTYAHLDRFTPAIEAFARREQQRVQAYPIDLELQPTDLPVKKGELIAFTGDTGLGVPHLHFEIRDQNLDAINPQLCAGVIVPDDLPPAISRIAVTPVGEGSLVQGGWQTQVYAAHAVGMNRYRIRETITLTGKAGFAISARDMTEGTYFRRGVYRYTVLIDGRQISTMTLNRAPMREAQLIGLHFDWDLMDRRLGRFERLYSEVPGLLPFVDPKSADAGLVSNSTLKDGPHEFTIVAEDIAGNHAEVSGTIVLSHAPDFTLESSGTELKLHFADPAGLDRVVVSTRSSAGAWRENGVFARPADDAHTMTIPAPTGTYDAIRVVAEDAWQNRSHPQFLFIRKTGNAASLALTCTVEQEFVRVVLHTTGTFTNPPRVAVQEGSIRQVVPMNPASEDVYVGTFRPAQGVGGTRRVSADAEVNGRSESAFTELELYPLQPGSNGSYTVDGGRLTIRYDSLSVYQPLLLQVVRNSNDGDPSYTLLPANCVLRDGIQVSVAAAPGRQHQGLYFHNRFSNRLLSSPSNGRGFTGRITRTLGDLAVMTDDQAPSIRRLRLKADRSHGATATFLVRDDLSGVEYDSMKLYIDDAVVIPEIDTPFRPIVCKSGSPLERGSHRFAIHLSDKAGNSTVIERRFSVR